MRKKRHNRDTVRIIGGNWRGRKISFPSVDGLRPTGDRIRETLFNWLQTDVGHARCLDLFAGSGALGFEAASRGAAEVDMVELDRQAYQDLIKSAQQLNASQCKIHHHSAQTFLKSVTLPYHIVFIDPPFQAELWEAVAHQLTEQGLLAEHARIYIEMGKQETPVFPDGWQILREKQAGEVKYCLFEYLTEV